MAWTADRWPLGGKLDTPTNLLTCANELRTELQARVGGTELDEFLRSKSLWNAVAELRTKVDGAIAATTYYDRLTGLPIVAIGATPGAGEENVWTECFGVGRAAWLNLIDGTEAVTAAWRPDEKSDPQKFLLNELQSVIDRLGYTGELQSRIAVNSIWEDSANSVKSEDMAFRDNIQERRVLIRFDLTGVKAAASSILNASLVVYGNSSADSYACPVRAARIIHAWSSGYASWNKAYSGHDWDSAGCEAVGTDRADWSDAGTLTGGTGIKDPLDVTDVVADWLASAGSVYLNLILSLASATTSIRDCAIDSSYPRLAVAYA